MATYFVPDFTVKYITHFIPILNITVIVICPLCKTTFRKPFLPPKMNCLYQWTINRVIGPAVTFRWAPDEVLGALGNTEVIQL